MVLNTWSPTHKTSALPIRPDIQKRAHQQLFVPLDGEALVDSDHLYSALGMSADEQEYKQLPVPVFVNAQGGSSAGSLGQFAVYY